MRKYKYLSPYSLSTVSDGRAAYSRKNIFNDKQFFTVWQMYDGMWTYVFNASGPCSSKEEAMQKLDKFILDKGFILIPEEQMDRFQNKLKLLM